VAVFGDAFPMKKNLRNLLLCAYFRFSGAFPRATKRYGISCNGYMQVAVKRRTFDRTGGFTEEFISWKASSTFPSFITWRLELSDQLSWTRKVSKLAERTSSDLLGDNVQS